MNPFIIKAKIQGRFRSCEAIGPNYNYLSVRVLPQEITSGMHEQYDVPLASVRKVDQETVLGRFPELTARYQVTFLSDAKFQNSATGKIVTIKAGSRYSTNNLLVRDGYVRKVFKAAGEQCIPSSLLAISPQL